MFQKRVLRIIFFRFGWTVSDRSYQKTEPFICNRPFLYMILTEDKRVLFIGQYVQAIGEVLEEN
jgi:hypothetical protein